MSAGWTIAMVVLLAVGGIGFAALAFWLTRAGRTAEQRDALEDLIRDVQTGQDLRNRQLSDDDVDRRLREDWSD